VAIVAAYTRSVYSTHSRILPLFNTALFHVVTLCSADEDACYATSDGGGAACPYTQCRAAILKYLSVRIT
jgi:hypothetical protein